MPNVQRIVIFGSVCLLTLFGWILLVCWTRYTTIATTKKINTRQAPADSHFVTRISEVCQRIQNGYYAIKPADSATRSTLRGVVDHYHRVEFCDIPKVGSTSWLMLFYELTHRERVPRAKFFSRHEYPWLGRTFSDRYMDLSRLGINHLSVGSEAHREIKDGLPDPRVEYYKFVVVRHPLERLASAYLDKVKDKMDKGAAIQIKNFFKKRNNTEKKEISFEDFLIYATTCEPCQMKYDYVAHLETLQTDLREILPHLDAVKYIEKFPKVKLRTTGDNRYAHMYTSLPQYVVKPIFNKYKADADMFGYTFNKYKYDKSDEAY